MDWIWFLYSHIFFHGQEEVLALVRGPHPAPRKDRNATKAIVKCTYTMAHFATVDRKKNVADRASQEKSLWMQNTFAEAIFTDTSCSWTLHTQRVP